MNTTDWKELAACRQRPEILSDFFAPTPPNHIKNICNGCPVLNECYEYALRNEMYGYWGGSTEKERYATRIRLGIPHPPGVGETFIAKAERQQKPIEHGTDRGYQQHRKQKVPMSNDCGCLKAHRLMVSKYRESKRQKELI